MTNTAIAEIRGRITEKWNTSRDACDVELATIDAWDKWAADNAAELIASYGSIDNALRHACDGGLTLGGDVQPVLFVYFADEACDSH